MGVLLDGIGSSGIRAKLLERMRAAGVDARRFRPLFEWPWTATNRTHRKILVCDNRMEFTGSMGIGESWEGNARHPGEWREMQFEFRGPSVHDLNGSFWEN